ncbi:sulfite exporter TauE/SafE family protein [Peteryoungia desertarenae]|uniref:Probable membrane transporter protein n=1 Tax=Peteryoungia desertarenae TaxID=1813451 RepID=A0ABX6QMW7_9HYPH|nr:sulfite exporter TauE/SafE family protein [Peteryoungia desertarenae]QLF69646.1 sulfite exporter TauE/SafE family protein [Peteryoungia desertarenae]
MNSDSLLSLPPLAATGVDLVILLVCIFVAGLARGFSGFGAALIFMPLASAIIGPKMAVAMLFVADLFTSWPMIPGAFRQSNKAEIGTMLIGAIMGVPTGTFILAYADPLALRWGIIVLVTALLLLLMSGWRYHGAPTKAATVSVGAVSGVLAGAAQVGGPPVIAYWLGGTLPAGLVRANIVFYFALGTVLTGITYSLAGLFTGSAILLGLIAAPLFGAGLWIGSHTFGKASEGVFRRICYSLIGISALLGMPLLDPWLR